MALLMLGLGVVAAWYAAQNFLQANAHRASPVNAEVGPNPGLPAPPWAQDVLDYFGDAARQAKAGNITGAEIQVDEAVAEMEQARVRSQPVQADFFGRVSTALDGVLKAQSLSEPAIDGSNAAAAGEQSQAESADLSTQDLFRHVALARIELAAVRSWQEPLPAGVGLAVNVAEDVVQDGTATSAGRNLGTTRDLASAPSISPGGTLRLPAGHVDIEAPRELSKDEILDPTSLHARFLDASLMPDTSEVLMPPESRRLSDNVRVEKLTIAGASQTLDGIHWRDVTFIETRLRYEDGPLDLRDVHFIHCTFGFPSDANGAAIANAIALGKTSLAIP